MDDEARDGCAGLVHRSTRAWFPVVPSHGVHEGAQRQEREVPKSTSQHACALRRRIQVDQRARKDPIADEIQAGEN